MPSPARSSTLFRNDLRRTIPFQVSIQQGTPEIRWEHWAIRGYFADAPHGLCESRAVAHVVAHDPDQAALVATCDARWERIGESDPDMVHFNTFIFILEALNTLPHVVIFETASGILLPMRGM